MINTSSSRKLVQSEEPAVLTTKGNGKKGSRKVAAVEAARQVTPPADPEKQRRDLAHREKGDIAAARSPRPEAKAKTTKRAPDVKEEYEVKDYKSPVNASSTSSPKKLPAAGESPTQPKAKGTTPRGTGKDVSSSAPGKDVAIPTASNNAVVFVEDEVKVTEKEDQSPSPPPPQTKKNTPRTTVTGKRTLMGSVSARTVSVNVANEDEALVNLKKNEKLPAVPTVRRKKEEDLEKQPEEVREEMLKLSLKTPQPNAPPPEQMKAYVRQLIRGNVRYLKGEPKPKGGDYRTDFLVSRQKIPPFAVLCCVDPRAAPEVIFDVDAGEMFTVRVLGNVVTDYAMASLEYAIYSLNVRFILVLGHTDSIIHQLAKARSPTVEEESPLTALHNPKHRSTRKRGTENEGDSKGSAKGKGRTTQVGDLNMDAEYEAAEKEHGDRGDNTSLKKISTSMIEHVPAIIMQRLMPAITQSKLPSQSPKTNVKLQMEMLRVCVAEKFTGLGTVHVAGGVMSMDSGKVDFFTS